MPNLDKKVNELVEDIHRQSQKENSDMIAEMASYKAAALKEAARAYESSARKYAKAVINAESAKILAELSQKHMQARMELVQKRSEMTDEVIKHAGEKLAEFAKTPEYADFLRKSVKKISDVLRCNRVVLYVKPEDMIYESLIKESFANPCTVQADDNIKIGGVRGYDNILFKIADETLDEKLVAEREYFVNNNSGLTISVR